MNTYFTWVEVINFNAIPAGTKLRLWVAKVTNPASVQIDINFKLRVFKMATSTKIESRLYESDFNMFFDMLSWSVTNRNEVNSSSVMFQAGSTVGDSNRFFNITPYTVGGFT